MRIGSALALCLVGSWYTPTAAGPAPAPASTQPYVIRGEVRFTPLVDEDKLPESYRLTPATFAYRMRRIAGDQKIDIHDVQFPSPVESPHPQNNTVHAEYFVPKGGGRRPGVVVLHILDGRFIVARMVSRFLAERGAAVLFVKMAYYGPRRPKAITRWPFGSAAFLERAWRQSVLDIRYARAWLASRPEVDPERTAITGISLGGIVAALAGAIETRFQRVALVLAGGDLATIVYESPETRRFRDQWVAAGGTKEKLTELVRNVDPLTHADRLKGRDVLMINGSQDRVIPTPCTVRLWKAAGKPPIMWLKAGHVGLFAYVLPMLDTLARHVADWETITQATIATQPGLEPMP